MSTPLDLVSPSPSPNTHIGRHVAWATTQLQDAGIISAYADAESIALYLLDRAGGDEAAVAAAFDEASGSYRTLIDRRARRVPLSHLTGQTSFRGITLAVGQGVFTPQPETSGLIDWVVRAATSEAWSTPIAVDLCTGAGTVALALANELPGFVVHGVEKDALALRWAAHNAAARVRAGDPPVVMHHGSAEDCLPELDGRVDLVVSNPPYVGTDESHIPLPEVLNHDPAVSLWAGPDGLSVIRLVEQTAARLLKDGGLLAVEHSDRQGRSAPSLLSASGCWEEICDHPDAEGLDRFVTARRRRRPARG